MRKRILIIAILLIVPTMVFAAKDGIITPLTVNPGKTDETAKFYLQGKQHIIHMPISSVIKPSKPQKVVIASFKYNWLGKASQNKRLTKGATSGTFLSFTMPEQTTGNYRYGFGAYSNAYGGTEKYEEYAGYTSDKLLIDSILGL